MIFTFKTEPFDHQRKYAAEHSFKPGHAMWWEQGSGKSKGLIDNAAILYCDGAISGLFYLGPSGLHRNFITKEIPKHLMDEIAERVKFMYWRTDKAETKWHQEEARALLAYKGFRILSMSYDGIMTDAGRTLAKEFLTSTRCLYGADESGRIANPKAARTVRVVASGPFAAFRRSMTGTPVANAPWDVHQQIQFLDSEFWAQHGLASYETMQAQFGIWEKVGRRVPVAQAKRGNSLVHYYAKNGIPEELQVSYDIVKKKDGSPSGVAFMKIPRLTTDEETGRPVYKNLNKLRSIIAPIRDRVLKKDALDLPPKLHTTIEYDISPAQQEAYDSLRKLGFAIIQETGETCSANIALTVLLRLQQIACGYLVADINPDNVEEPRVRPIMPNPRIDLLMELTEDLSHPALIWGRFQADIEQILAALKKQGKKAAPYYGGISDEECGENENLFHNGDIQFLCLSQSKGGEGLTLVEAQTAYFYSNSFSMRQRAQASDRPHRIGQTHAVNEVDIVARGTVDEKLILSFQSKFDVACQVTGDQLPDWLAW